MTLAAEKITVTRTLSGTVHVHTLEADAITAGPELEGEAASRPALTGAISVLE